MMRILDCTSVPSKVVPEPYRRSLQLVLDKSDGKDVQDFTFLLSTLFPYEGKTDSHVHPVDELIYIVSGYGYSLGGGQKTPVKTGTMVYASAGEEHQIVNESNETMRLLCVYIPALPDEVIAKFKGYRKK